LIGLLAPAALGALLALVRYHVVSRRERTARVYVHWWAAAIGAFLVEFVLYSPPTDQQPWALSFGPWIWVVTRMVLLAVVVRNVRAAPRLLSPWLIVLAGLALNTLVIASNDGFMPQSVQAAEVVWGAAPGSENAAQRLSNTRPMDETTRLAPLGDVIAQPAWLPRRNVISIGDVLLSLGIAAWTFQTVSRSRNASGIVDEIGCPIHAGVQGPGHRSTRRAKTSN